MTGLRVAFFLALRQLVARWRLNLTAVFGVALGVLVLIGMSGVMRGFQVEFLSQIQRVAAHARVLAEEDPAETSLVRRLLGQDAAVAVRHERTSGREVRISAPSDLVERLESHPAVLAARPGIDGRALVASTNQEAGAQLLGVIPDRQDECTPMSPFVVSGAWADLERGRNTVALGVGLAKELEVRVGDRIRLSAPVGEGETLVVVATVDTDIPALDDTRAWVPLRTAQAILGRADVVAHVDVRLTDPMRADDVAAELSELVDYRVESWRDANANMLDLFRLQNAIVSFVIAAILVVGGFGILAIQVMLVLQKRRDIAILRAIGLCRADIVGCFLVQGVLIAFAGALLGDLGGALLLDLLRTLPVTTGGDIVDASGFLVYEDMRVYVWGLVFGSLIGTLAGIAPALRAARVGPVEVLRGQIA